MIKKILYLFLFFVFLMVPVQAKENKNIYEKIDLFGEVLEKVKSEYVDDIDQSDIIDSAINGALQSLDPYSA